MSLAVYRRKRDFHKTAEPEGKRAKTRGGNAFVVQKHAASRLHYDFRLELDGVLKSWAVPKGPSLDPKTRALAVEVEDHPVAYGGFEGIIPAGEYGGGTVMLWDRGTWEPVGDQGDAAKQLRAGRLHFVVHGEKLRGEWTLARMKTERGRAQWLLIKRSDDEARPGDAYGIQDRKAKSILTGRTMDEIRRNADRTWTKHGEKRKEPVAQKTTKARRVKKGTPKRRSAPLLTPATIAKLPGVKRRVPPGTFTPQLATLSPQAPEGDDWLHELKFDGYRILAYHDGRKVRLVTRNGNDWTSKFPRIAEAVGAMNFKGLLDGELVAMDEHGVSQFQKLQNAVRLGRQNELLYYVFDLPYCGGYDLGAVPLVERKAALAQLLATNPEGSSGAVRYSEHIVGDGAKVLAGACRRGLEGIVSKHAASPYGHRRSDAWLKVKCHGRQEFVIAGFTAPRRSRAGFGALLLGYFDDGRKLKYAGKVGTGFTEQSLRDLKRRLDELETSECPFVEPPAEARRNRPTWVEPKLVAEIEFTEWTADGALRHPSFQGLREDKEAGAVVRESRFVRRAHDTKSTTARAGKLANGTSPKAGMTKAAAAKAGAVVRSGADAEVAGVRISHPDRVLYPDVGLTKLDVARYYEAVGRWILPYVVDRPLTIVRCPEGQAGECFFQKNWKNTLPKQVGKVDVPFADGVQQYVMIDDLAGLIGLVQVGALELHPWGSKVDKLDRPDQIIFDLDPGPGVTWKDVRAGAVQIRDLLAELKLETFLRTSGGKGLHVVLPLARRNDWDEVKSFAHHVSQGLERHQPTRFVSVMAKDRRRGKIFVDYLRNQRGATSVASYSTRNRAGAPVAMPIGWDELGRLKSPAQFTVENALPRLAKRKADPWAEFFATRQTLTQAVQRAARQFAEG
jgi:bifunctional non-homologous end joining protein LigD